MSDMNITEDEDKAPTYTYKVYAYIDGLGQSVYQAKERGWLGFGWVWLRLPFIFDGEIRQWFSREGVYAFLKEHSEKLNEKSKTKRLDAKRAKLKLVLIEEVNL